MQLILSKRITFAGKVRQKVYSSSKLMDNAGKLSAQYFIDNVEDPFNKKVLVIVDVEILVVMHLNALL